MDGQDQGSAVIFQRTAESNFTEDQEQTGLIQRAQQGFPGISPMCTQEAHSATSSPSSPSHSHIFARFLYKSWLGWNCTDSLSCLKICSCRRNGDLLHEVLEDSSGSPHWAPVCKTLQLLSAAAFPRPAGRAEGAAEAALLAPHYQRVQELDRGAQQHTAGRRGCAHHSHSCSLESFCFRVLVPGVASSSTRSCHQLFWVTAAQAQSK